MPHRLYSHSCPFDGSLLATAASVCTSCGARGRFIRWGYSMIEAMAMYATAYGLSSVGPIGLSPMRW